MDNGPREGTSKKSGKHSLEKVKPSKTIFFLNKDLVRLVHYNRPNDICEIYNFNQDKMQTLLYSDFKKHRKRAFSTKNTTKIIGNVTTKSTSKTTSKNTTVSTSKNTSKNTTKPTTISTTKSTNRGGFVRYTFVGDSWRQTAVSSENDFNSIFWNGSAWVEI